MADLKDFPEYLGFTSHGKIAIHADWPVYPEEHGWELALLWLTVFPSSTAFRAISDIDRCILLLVETGRVNTEDVFDQRNYHVAVWHDDLLELQRLALVDGVHGVSERRWRQLREQQLRQSAMDAGAAPPGDLFVERDGGLVKIEFPSLESYDDEGSGWPEFVSGEVVVTRSGHARAVSLLGDMADPALLGHRVEHLVEAGYFDTAVREACVLLEDRIKTWLDCTTFGSRLIEELVGRLRRDEKYIESYVRVTRADLRSVFAFIRNEVMHNVVVLEDVHCRALLFRVARLMSELDHLLAEAERAT